MAHGFEEDKTKADLDELVDMKIAPLYLKLSQLQSQVNEMGANIYPVGSIYISTNSTNPSKLFGGTWERYAAGRMLMGVANGNNAGSTGGATKQTINIDYKHLHDIVNPYTGDLIFSVAPYNPSSPDHAYTLKPQTPASSEEVEPGKFQYIPITTSSSNKYFTTDVRGETEEATKTINTLPPYITVFMWRRTA